jgi:hypothetical protein
LLAGITVVSSCINSVKALRFMDQIEAIIDKIKKLGISLVVYATQKQRLSTKFTDSVVNSTVGSSEYATDDDSMKRQLTQIFYEGIDNCVSELEVRFGERNTAIASSLECLWPQSKTFLEPSRFAAITELIAIDIQSTLVTSECTVARQLIANQFDSDRHKDLSDVCQILFPVKTAFPSVYSIYAAALTLGVSTASCEASFSTLTRVLTPYKRSMQHPRKVNLVLLSFQRQYTQNLDLGHFVNIFSQKSRRIQL